MKRLTYAGLAFFVLASLSLAAPKPKERTFVGYISDSMCGLKHMMAGDPKGCTLGCVKKGEKFVLADAVHNKVYELNDQKKPEEFAGQKVTVIGTLSGQTIKVVSIQAAP